MSPPGTRGWTHLASLGEGVQYCIGELHCCLKTAAGNVRCRLREPTQQPCPRFAAGGGLMGWGPEACMTGACCVQGVLRCVASALGQSCAIDFYSGKANVALKWSQGAPHVFTTAQHSPALPSTAQHSTAYCATVRTHRLDAAPQAPAGAFRLHMCQHTSAPDWLVARSARAARAVSAASASAWPARSCVHAHTPLRHTPSAADTTARPHGRHAATPTQAHHAPLPVTDRCDRNRGQLSGSGTSSLPCSSHTPRSPHPIGRTTPRPSPHPSAPPLQRPTC